MGDEWSAKVGLLLGGERYRSSGGNNLRRLRKCLLPFNNPTPCRNGSQHHSMTCIDSSLYCCILNILVLPDTYLRGFGGPRSRRQDQPGRGLYLHTNKYNTPGGIKMLVRHTDSIKWLVGRQHWTGRRTTKWPSRSHPSPKFRSMVGAAKSRRSQSSASMEQTTLPDYFILVVTPYLPR